MTVPITAADSATLAETAAITVTVAASDQAALAETAGAPFGGEPLVVSAEDVARRIGLPLPLSAEDRWLIEESIRDQQAVAEAYLGVPVVPTTVTEGGRWPTGAGWALTYQPVIQVLGAEVEIDPVTSSATGSYAVTYVWGLDVAAGGALEPIRRWVRAHAGATPEARRLVRVAAVGSARSITSLSAEGQSVSYSAEGTGGSNRDDALVDEFGLPTLRTLDRWRRANRRIYQRPYASRPAWRW